MSNTQISVRQARDIDADNAYYVTVTTDFDARPHTYTVHTNRHGQGLWIDGRQIEGTSQFSIGRNAAAAYRRYFAKM